MKEMARSGVMLLPINDTPNVLGVVPGKVFEYMAVKRLILCIGPPEGDAAKIVKEAEAGYVVGFDDEAGMQAALRALFARYQSKTLALESNDKILKYTRRSLAGTYAELLNKL